MESYTALSSIKIISSQSLEDQKHANEPTGPNILIGTIAKLLHFSLSSGHLGNSKSQQGKWFRQIWQRAASTLFTLFCGFSDAHSQTQRIFILNTFSDSAHFHTQHILRLSAYIRDHCGCKDTIGVLDCTVDLAVAG